MRDDYDSRDDSRDRAARPTSEKSAALGVVAVTFAVVGFLALLGCFGCVSAYEGLRGRNLSPMNIEFPLLMLGFGLCGFVSLATTFTGAVTGVISLYDGRAGRMFGTSALLTVAVWVAGVCWLVSLLLQL